MQVNEGSDSDDFNSDDGHEDGNDNGNNGSGNTSGILPEQIEKLLALTEDQRRVNTES